MKWLIFNSNSQDRYLNFLDSHPFSGIWHYPNWLDFQLACKKACDGCLFGVEIDGQIVLTGLLLIQESKPKTRYAYIPGGLLYHQMSPELYNFFLENLMNLVRDKKLLYTQLDSIMLYSHELDQLIRQYSHHNFKVKLPIPGYTNIIKLKYSNDEILNLMKPKGRYNIKLAAKKGVHVNIGKINELETFYSLLNETAERDGFRINPQEYYRMMLEKLPQAVFLTAYYENKMIAGGIFTYTRHQGLYYYGASANEMRHLMAPYLVQWTAISIAKEKNCSYFDFMGIASPDDPHDRLTGVTEFKLKFGGQVIRFNPSYHIIHKPINYALFNLIKALVVRIRSYVT